MSFILPPDARQFWKYNPWLNKYSYTRKRNISARTLEFTWYYVSPLSPLMKQRINMEDQKFRCFVCDHLGIVDTPTKVLRSRIIEGETASIELAIESIRTILGVDGYFIYKKALESLQEEYLPISGKAKAMTKKACQSYDWLYRNVIEIEHEAEKEYKKAVALILDKEAIQKSSKVSAIEEVKTPEAVISKEADVATKNDDTQLELGPKRERRNYLELNYNECFRLGFIEGGRLYYKTPPYNADIKVILYKAPEQFVEELKKGYERGFAEGGEFQRGPFK